MKRELLRIEGMSSERTRRSVVAVVSAVPGVQRVFANLADHTLQVECDERTSLAAIINAVRAAGHDVSVFV